MSPERLRTPLVRRDGALVEATWEDALDRIAGTLRDTPGDAVGVLGGTRSTNEDNYLLLRLFRGTVGTNSIDFRTDTAHPLPTSDAPWGLPGSIADVERADAIVVVGCDLTEEYPIIWLRVKKAVDRGARLVIANPWQLEIARWATHSMTHRAGTEAALLAALGGQAPVDEASAVTGVPADALRAAQQALAGAARPLVLIGRGAFERSGAADVLRALDAMRSALPALESGLLAGRGNSGGAQVLGLVPDMLPGYRPIEDAQARAAIEAAWGRPIPPSPGRTARGMLEAARAGGLRVLYVVGADPALDYPDAQAWAEARTRPTRLLVVHDLFLTHRPKADVVLPVLTYAEHGGTVGNIEGRIQRQDAAVRSGHRPVGRADLLRARGAAWRRARVRVRRRHRVGDRGPGPWVGGGRAPPVREPPSAPRPRATGRRRAARRGLALVVGTRLFDRGTMALRCPGIRGQAGEPFVGLHPEDARRLGVAEATVCEVRSARGTLRLPARVLPTLHPGHAYVPRGYESAPVSALLDERGPVAVTVRPVGGAA